MKRQAVTLILLLMTCFLASGANVKADSALIPHEDPSQVKTAMDTYSFLSQYGVIFALVSDRQYGNASKLSEQLSHITAPADLSYVVTKYNQLTQQLVAKLNELQTTLDSASNLLDQNRLNEVRPVLEQASVLVTDAKILMVNLQDATLTISERLGVFSPRVQSRVWQAYEQLQAMLQRLNDLIEQYHIFLESTTQRVEATRAQNLQQPTLSLILNTTKCYVGGYLAASGALSAKGAPLAYREVKLYVAGTEVAAVNTDRNGTYHWTLKMPFNYVDSVLVDAFYAPQNNDRSTYLAALTSPIKVQILFHKTILNVSVPDRAHPGLPLIINGNVSDINGVNQRERQVKVTLDGNVQSQVETDVQGAFTAKLTVDPLIQMGKHNLTVSVEPKGLYSPTSEQKTIIIEKIASQLQFNAPQFVLLPTQLQLTGKVNSASGPLKAATVQIDFTNISATTKTDDDGSFNLTVNIALNTALAGYQDLTVKALPSQPWQAATETKVSVFTLNSVSTSVALASAFSFLAVAYIQFAKTKHNDSGQFVLETSDTPPQPNETVITQIKFEGIKGQTVKAYLEALTVVQKATGKHLTANLTLREYTQITKSEMREAAQPFLELTRLTEKSLYAPHAPNPEEEQTALDLAKTIRRLLNATI